MRRIVAIGAVGALCCLGGPAYGQSASSFFYPTKGFSLGEKSAIHTELATSVVYDSNSQRVDQDQSTIQADDVRINIRPGLLVDVPGTRARLSMFGHFLYSQFLNVNGATGGEDNALFGGDVGVEAQVGTDRSPAALTIRNLLLRTPTILDEQGTNATDERAFRAWTNQGSVVGTFRPGGGALEFDVGYSNTLLIYDLLDPTQRHGAVLEARYLFLPRTALIFHADYSLFEPERRTESSLETNPTNRSAPLILWAGASGQVTPRITATIAAGYAHSFTFEGDFFSSLAESSQETVVAKARVGYAATDTVKVSIGYERSLRPVVEFDSLVSDLLDARFSAQFTNRLVFQVFGSYDFRSFGLDDAKAQVAMVDTGVTYYFFDFLTGGLKYRLTNQTSDSQVSGPNLLVGSFTRHQVFISVGLQY